jgi:hypothetical protein
MDVKTSLSDVMSKVQKDLEHEKVNFKGSDINLRILSGI